MNYNRQSFPQVDCQKTIYKKNQLAKGCYFEFWMCLVLNYLHLCLCFILKCSWSEWITPEMATQTAPPLMYSNSTRELLIVIWGNFFNGPSWQFFMSPKWISVCKDLEIKVINNMSNCYVHILHTLKFWISYN